MSLDSPVSSMREVPWPNFPEELMGKRLAMAIPDSTRPFPLQDCLIHWLPAMERSCRMGGQIEILVGLGLHRRMKREELAAHVGRRIYTTFPVLNHDPKQCISLGKTHEGCPIQINSKLIDVDGILALGVVEPHQYAGFSGGYKAISVGLAGKETISWLHSPASIDAEGVGPGCVAQNPFRSSLKEIALALPPICLLNIVLGPQGERIQALLGNPEWVIHNTTQVALKRYGIPLPKEEADLVIAFVDGVKGVNLYQSTRAFSGLTLPGRSLLKDGGTFILCAECAEGIGMGQGEMAFRKAMEMPKGELETRKTLFPGEQRAYVVKRLMDRYRFELYSPYARKSWKKMGFHLANTVQDVVDEIDPQLCYWVSEGCGLVLCT